MQPTYIQISPGGGTSSVREYGSRDALDQYWETTILLVNRILHLKCYPPEMKENAAFLNTLLSLSTIPWNLTEVVMEHYRN